VRAFELIEHRGLLVTVLELLPGENLYDRLRASRPNRDTAIRWMSELAHGLSELHKRMIVHRDISAKNALIRPDGTVALSDFGVSRRIDDPTLTVASEQFGSLIYISPQQREDPHQASFADDVFALGQLYFHVVTGKNPHNAGSLEHHEHDVAPAYAALIESMRHPERTHRPQNAQAVVDELGALS
jgi:serine/threonine-protein kinase